MIQSNLKDSLFYLKHVFKTGSKKQRDWALEEIKKRWKDMELDEQLNLIFDDQPLKKEVYG